MAKHRLASVTNLGLPEADYNDTLAAFDHEMIIYVDDSDKARMVLVETFGGKRTYYFYAALDFDLEGMKEHFHARYPENAVEWIERSDPAAFFIRKYMHDFG